MPSQEELNESIARLTRTGKEVSDAVHTILDIKDNITDIAKELESLKTGSIQPKSGSY